MQTQGLGQSNKFYLFNNNSSKTLFKIQSLSLFCYFLLWKKNHQKRKSMKWKERSSWNNCWNMVKYRNCDKMNNFDLPGSFFLCLQNTDRYVCGCGGCGGGVWKREIAIWRCNCGLLRFVCFIFCLCLYFFSQILPAFETCWTWFRSGRWEATFYSNDFRPNELVGFFFQSSSMKRTFVT